MTNKDNFRSFFPIFKKNPKLIYFDSATTSLKPKPMIDALTNFYNNNGLNIRSFSPLCLKNTQDIARIKKKLLIF